MCGCLQVPSDKFQGVTAANLVRSSGANVTAVVYEDSAYGYGLAFNFIAGFTKGRQAFKPCHAAVRR
jgi:ABC-type branched-subunit amino acid transport system substrate-binding protein